MTARTRSLKIPWSARTVPALNAVGVWGSAYSSLTVYPVFDFSTVAIQLSVLYPTGILFYYSL